MEHLNSLKSNVTALMEKMTMSNNKVKDFESSMHENAEKHFSDKDKNLNLDVGQKAELYENQV